MREQINVRFADPPQPGKKWARIKTVDGQQYFLDPNDLSQFSRGQIYEVEVEEDDWGSGPVKIIISGPYNAQQAPRQQGGYQPRRQWSGSQRGRFQPRVYQGGGGQPQQQPQQQYKQPATPEERREMFIMGVVGRWGGSGKFAASEIPVLIQAACEGWDRLVAHKPAPPINREQYTRMVAAESQAYGQQYQSEPPQYPDDDPGPEPR